MKAIVVTNCSECPLRRGNECSLDGGLVPALGPPKWCPLLKGSHRVTLAVATKRRLRGTR